MRSWFATLTELVIPAGATGSTPRTVIGRNVPPELVAYYAPLQVVQVTLYRQSASTYVYQANIYDPPAPGVPVTPYLAWGTCSEDGGGIPHVREVARISSPLVPSLPSMTFGAAALGSELIVTGQFSSLQIEQGAHLLVADSADMAFGARSAGRGVLGANLTTQGPNLATSTGAEAAIPSSSWDVEPTFDLAPGRLFRVQVNVLASRSGGTTLYHRALVQVRQGAQTTTGQMLASWLVPIVTTSAGNRESQSMIGYFRNATSSTVSTPLSLTVQRLNGDGSVIIGGQAAGGAARIVVEDIGNAAQLAGLDTVPSVV